MSKYCLFLLFCLAAGVPAFADGTINIADPANGSGWIFDNNVVTITADGNYTVTGTSTDNRIVISKEVTATVTLQNASIHSAVASPFLLSSDTVKGSQVTLILVGNNELVTTGARAAGLQVEDSARLTIEGAGSLVAVSHGGMGDPAGIGGGGFGNAGTINITGGTVYASGGSGPGIGAGAGGTGAINITGGAVIADNIGIGNGRIETNISGASTLVLSPSINTTTFGGAKVLTGTDVEVSAYITTGDDVADVTLHADLTIPSGCTLIVPASIVFDANQKRVNGALVNYGGMINEDNRSPARDINLSDMGRENGDGWVSRDNVVTITASGDRTITGSTDAVSVVIEKDVTAVITLDNVRIHSTVASPFSLSSDDTKGSDVTLILVGSNELVTTGARVVGLRVEDNARLTIEGAGSLVVVSPGGQDDPAAIGGSGFSSAGTINITGGTVYASGGTGAGIGGGAGAIGGVINITGGTVIADEIGIGPIGQSNESRTTTNISGANTLVLSPSINATGFGQAKVLTGTDIGISCAVLPESMDYTVTLNEDLFIPSGSTLIVPAGIVFDMNYKGLTNNGIVREYGSIINMGTLTGTPLVGAIDLSWITIPAQTYTGDSLKPAVTVRNENFTLAPGIYYTVTSYDNNVNAGTATVTITDLGNNHPVPKPFTIDPKPLAAGWIDTIPVQGWTGDSIKPAVVVKDSSRTLTLNTDYTVAFTNNVYPGTATATVTGTGNYTDTASITFTISPKTFVDARWVQDIPAQPYTGDSIKPAVVVRDGIRTLTLNTDYTVAYTNNVYAGTATATVTGIGNYAGTVVKTFTITTGTALVVRQDAIVLQPDSSFAGGFTLALSMPVDFKPESGSTVTVTFPVAGITLDTANTKVGGALSDGFELRFTRLSGTEWKLTVVNKPQFRSLRAAANTVTQEMVGVKYIIGKNVPPNDYTITADLKISLVDNAGAAIANIADIVSVQAEMPRTAVTGVSFYNGGYILRKGNALQLTATVVPAEADNRNVSWATSNGNVATVSGSGQVTAVSAGEATITVTTDDGKETATCRIQVLGGKVTQDKIQYNIIEKDTVLYNITARDSVIYNIVAKDSIVYNLVTRDSADYNIIIVDSVRYNITVRDTVIPARDSVVYNLIYRDTIKYTLAPERIYIVTDITGAEHIVTEDASVVRAGTVLRIEGLQPGKTFSIYTVTGEKYYSGTAQSDVFRLDNIPEGVYILYHDGQYSKFYY